MGDGVIRKTPGTEDRVMEPMPTFSTCYSAPFITLHAHLLLSVVFILLLPHVSFLRLTIPNTH